MKNAWVALAVLSLMGPVRAEEDEAAEADDPIGRMNAARSGDSGIRTDEQQAAIFRAAAEEAEKYGIGKRHGFATAAPVAGSAWVNIGPTTADFEKNGGTYFKIDSGRARKILVDPRDANVVYLATSGGGVWKTRDATASLAHWAPITEGVVALSIGSIAMNPAAPDSLVLGLGDPFDVRVPGQSILTSDDGGQTWSSAASLAGSYPGSGSVYTATTVRDIGIDPGGDIVLAATDAGLFRHTSGGVGAGWALVDVDTTTHHLQDSWSLAYAGPHIWLLGSRDLFDAATPGKIWRSTDDGAHWADVTSALGSEASDVGRITLSAGQVPSVTPWRVYALASTRNRAYQKDVFRSDDGGATWSSLSMHGCMSSGPGYCTTEAPANPTNHQLDLDLIHDQASYNQMIVADPANANNVFIGGNLSMVRSTNGGTTWTVMTDWLPFALTTQTGGLDTGTSSPQYAHADWHTATIAHVGGTAYFYGGNDGGIIKASTNFLTAAQGSVTWDDKINRGVISHLIYSVASGKERPTTTCTTSGADIVYGGFQDNGTRLRVLTGSSNNYVGYNQIIGGDGFGVGLGCTSGPAGAMGSQLLSTYVTRISTSGNSGSSFTTRVNQSLSSGSCPSFSSVVGCATGLTPGIVIDWARGLNFRMKVVPDLTTDFTYLTPLADNYGDGQTGSPGTAGSAARGYVYRSTDNGVTWNSINGTIHLQDGVTTVSAFNRQVRNVVSHPKKAGAYAAVSGGRVYVTVNNGTDWFESQRAVAIGGSDYLATSAVAFDPNDSTGGTVWIGSSLTSATDSSTAPAHLWKCTGATAVNASCTVMSTGLNTVLPVNAIKVDLADSNTVYVGTEIGMYRSTDGGAHFARYGTNLPLVSVTDIALNADSSAIRVSTYGRGFWEIYPSTGVTAGVAGNGDLDFSGVVDGFDLVREAAIEFNDRTTADFAAAGDLAFNNVIDESDLSALVGKLGGTP